ncbi:plasmid fertility inhibition factor family protein [Mannheimia pernigra]|uniref:plasmid fertility inhibition factor family protein n=1 Tax=Mannheimia pernigra TaxID=111844 RepID=UPI0013192DDA|nr:hypothetical protein [Mannheimia pernigra]QHB18049.1 hypothetical protein GM695_08420 [Mannheimia pernigra]
MELRKFPHHVIFIEQAKYGLQNYLLFELLTRTGQAVYFKHPIFHTPNKEMKIVFVQDYKFLSLWQNMQFPQEPQLSFGNESAWRNDRKFLWAEKALSQGREQPINLAEVTCTEYLKRIPIYEKRFCWFNKFVGYKYSNQVECSFIDGITRTIWLLANGVRQFPVYVYNEQEAVLLSKYAGIQQNAYYDLNELNIELEELINGKNLYEPLSWQE